MNEPAAPAQAVTATSDRDEFENAVRLHEPTWSLERYDEGPYNDKRTSKAYSAWLWRAIAMPAQRCHWPACPHGGDCMHAERAAGFREGIEAALNALAGADNGDMHHQYCAAIQDARDAIRRHTSGAAR